MAWVRRLSGNKGRRFAAGLCISLCWQLPAAASPDETVRGEIEHLLTHLETSGCEFFRNGDWHEAGRARRHIERKYAWLVKRDLVASTEQFIERAATESSRSGEAYLVRCAQSESVPSADWMTDALTRLRGDAAASREQ